MATKNINRKSKKEQFIKQSSGRKPLLIAILLVAVIGTVAAGLLLRGPGAEDDGAYFGEPAVQTRSYIGRVVPMTAIEPLIEGGWVSIPLTLLEENDIVYFEVENNEGFLVPLMAYITPSGRIFTGSSMCEPCQGRSFFLAGETLVCETCRTTYTIESHEFISGSQDCGRYPPVYMQPVIENGMVSIALEDILQWQIRTY
jgi:hypothetical protein